MLGRGRASKALTTALRLSLVLSLAAISLSSSASSFSSRSNRPSPFLLVFAGDTDEADEDFIATVDLRPGSPTSGKVIATTPIGTKASMPHHLEYQLPPPGRLLFANSHHHEETLLLDFRNPMKIAIGARLRSPPPLRFPHDYFRLSNGNVLAGFLRSDGPSPRSGDPTSPGGHGGIAEFSSAGRFIRFASAAANVPEPVRPYAIIALLDRDRIVTTSAAMMEKSAADVVQIWRYSDFKLLHTIPVPPGRNKDGSVAPTAAHAPFALRAMSDGSVLVSTYGCGLNLLTGITSKEPKISNIYTFDADEPKGPGEYRGACAVPLVLEEKYWLMPVGGRSTLITLDITNTAKPREISRLNLPRDFAPHWLARDPRSYRLVLGAHHGGQKGMFILRVDAASGRVQFDDTVHERDKPTGYVDLASQKWPHSKSGPGWAHAALFLPPTAEAN